MHLLSQGARAVERTEPIQRGGDPNRGHTILVFERRLNAEEAVRALLDAGIRSDCINFFVRATPKHGISGDDLQQSLEQGGVAGAELGAIAGLVLFTIPGLGPVLGTGALATALTGAIFGSCIGGVAGALGGAGLSQADAMLAEHHLREGKAVVVVENGGEETLSAIARSRGPIEIVNAELSSAETVRPSDVHSSN